MKYVKVLMYNEYSVFEVIEEYEKTIKCKLNNCENGYIIIGKNNVIAQADTIEELCDEFVAEELFVETNYIAHINKSVGVEKNLDYFVNYFIESNKVTKDKLLNVYGAIWTSKGLIYVAKMDNEGKLVLI